MTQIEQLTPHILSICDQHNVSLYECKWVQQGSMRILQVAITKEDGSMDIDTCQEVSNHLSEVLDEMDAMDFEYYLEVCSAGAERALRSEKEVLHAVGKHVYAKFHQTVDKKQDVTGTLLSFDSNELVIEYRDKQRKKTVKTDYGNVSMIRLAVTL